MTSDFNPLRVVSLHPAERKRLKAELDEAMLHLSACAMNDPLALECTHTTAKVAGLPVEIYAAMAADFSRKLIEARIAYLQEKLAS